MQKLIDPPIIHPHEKIIVVIGLSACGKTTTANQLSDKHDVVALSTDDYLCGDSPMVDLYHKILTTIYIDDKVIVEGMMCYVLLRDNSEFLSMVDVVIEVVASTSIRGQRYNNERESKDFTAFDKVYRSMYNQILSENDVKHIRFIQHLTHKI